MKIKEVRDLIKKVEKETATNILKPLLALEVFNKDFYQVLDELTKLIEDLANEYGVEIQMNSNEIEIKANVLETIKRMLKKDIERLKPKVKDTEENTWVNGMLSYAEALEQGIQNHEELEEFRIKLKK